jgi:hypothetical protein
MPGNAFFNKSSLFVWNSRVLSLSLACRGGVGSRGLVQCLADSEVVGEDLKLQTIGMLGFDAENKFFPLTHSP